MKIKKLILTSFLFYFPFIFIILILFSINIIIKDFNYSHKSHNVYVPEINWVKYYFNLKKKKIENFFVNSQQETTNGLPEIKIFVSEKSSKALLSSVPFSTKQYVDAEIKMNGSNEKVQMRYLGDNPRNWMFHKKSIRLKLRKSKMIKRQRYFQYKNYEENILQRYTGYLFAKNLNLLTPKTRLVDLSINDENVGVYLETERLNESFLRRNKIMPINIYKGEAYMNSEKKIGLEFYLDQNPGLWEKISYFNMVDKDDRNDLSSHFKNIKQANNSNDKLNNIIKNENLDLLSRASLLELMINNQNGDTIHNRRLALDPWSGNLYVIPYDYAYNISPIIWDKNFLDRSYTNLFAVLNQSSNFLNYKYQLLYEIIENDQIFEKVINDLLILKEQYLVSRKKDLGSINSLKFSTKRNIAQYENEFNQLIKSLYQRKQNILNFLQQAPSANWQKTNQGFDIILDKPIPINNLTIKFDKKVPNHLIFDFNSNGIIDEMDIYYYPNKSNEFIVDLKLFANRILINNNILSSEKYLKIGKTKFSFFLENNYFPKQLLTSNNSINTELTLKNSSNIYSTPNLHNKPIENSKKIDDINILKGEIIVNENLIINKPSKILEGTTFTINKGKSIIFENKVDAKGTKEKPIIFQSKSENDYFGTVAIYGNNTNGSTFENVIIQNGSGDIVNDIIYISALSLHSTKNLKLKNITVKNNSIYDDMMHIIYSQNIEVENSKFLNAFGDSIDVDISKNISFKNIKIKNSGNDGIDFMESTATLESVNITSSGDKAVSVGENSNISINNSNFKSNKYGIASKDLSVALINNSTFENNEIQLSAYKKNWRYGSSGSIKVKNSEIFSNKNVIISDKLGDILILSSNIVGEIEKNKNVKIINN